MYRICKTIEIESGHMLSRHPENCRFPHGHTRKVELVLEAEKLDGDGMVCDFKAVKELAAACIERFDHALCVNTADPMYGKLKEAYGERVIGFEQADPTTEVLAKAFFDDLSRALEAYAARTQARYALRASVRLVRVRVWETSSSWAEYEVP